MKEIVLDIPDNKYTFFIELVNNLGFVKVHEDKKLSKKQKVFVDDTRASLNQVDQHLNGEVTLKTADQFFDEL